MLTLGFLFFLILLAIDIYKNNKFKSKDLKTEINERD